MEDPRMIRNLKPQTVQVWTLVSLQPVHRAIVIRTTERIRASMASMPKSASAIEWRNVVIASDLPPLGIASGPLGKDSNVVIVDRRVLLTHASAWMERGIPKAKNSIRLLWSWGEQGHEDLSWCTELGMDGNIFNIPSLERWCTIGVQRATSSEQPSSSILSGVNLPKIPKTK
jgi:hypothetical protein